jgi:23S rRNA (uracil1939-C5)-methyltransferase
LRKGEKLEIIIEGIDYPNKPYGFYNEKKVFPQGNAIIGQKVAGFVTKMRKDKIEIKRLEIIERANNEIDPKCEYFNLCGGCTYQNLSYSDQLELKVSQVQKLLENNIESKYVLEKTVESPTEFEYRNKMEFTFGNSEKDGPLTLGLHKKGSFFDIINVNECLLMDEDFRKILDFSVKYFEVKGLPFYHKVSHEGYLRYLVIRKGDKTKELLVNLITSSQLTFDTSEWLESILGLNLSSKIVGVLHTLNDNISDTVNSEEETILYGSRDINEKIFDLNFRISPYSFFQTNSLGVEKLYEKVLDYVSQSNPENKVVFDLFSGTGTIGQVVSKMTNASKVYGIEIVEEAVNKANENARLNGLDNCEFIAGDVFAKLDEFDKQGIEPDIIILDPPRAGVREKAITKILKYNVKNIVYVSCNPKSLVQDLRLLEMNGYVAEKVCCVDMFPQTPHVETVVLMSRVEK